MEGLERIVLEHPFFAGLGPEFGATISGCARNLRFAAGEYLFREDDRANEFYLIRHGTVALELHAPGQPAIVIATLRPSSTPPGSCRPIAGISMRALPNSCVRLKSTRGACATNAKPIMISATS
jgi:hypothetical protein